MPSYNCHVYGDHIDTDRIIAGKYTKTLDFKSLAIHALEDLDPSFSTSVRHGDFLVAGDNFGCGSSREQAPLALKHTGIQAVIAQSFARIFYRNAINVGLRLLEIPDHKITSESQLILIEDQGEVHDQTYSTIYQIQPLPPIMAKILGAGGLVPYLREHQSYEGHTL